MKRLLPGVWAGLLLPLAAMAAEQPAGKPAIQVVGKPGALEDLAKQPGNPTRVMTQTDSMTFLQTGKPKCRKGTQQVSFAAGQFLYNGESLSTEDLIGSLKRRSLAKRVSCLEVEAADYDRAVFMQLSDALVGPLGVSIFWNKPSL
ncbi:hypothetical protein [Tahibacter harae]|uniref:Uncharacterized protein n=1 Tax=Tahibacter harae TaxID=2963937 RepID=A0ABT1QWR8_9GAMM|nr:hypothetical protein [Tahibacter harae]MCQ4166731.1 hypothetical protein [Tahibacter harae]